MSDEKTTEQPWGRMTCKIPRVDLSSSRASTEERDEHYYRRWPGGSGLIAQMLRTEVPAGIDALGAKNKLLFALSPVTGTPIYATGRNGVGAKSPAGPFVAGLDREKMEKAKGPRRSQAADTTGRPA
jgi:aldehyde:ferredoxin oxidoreductase